MSYLGSVPSTGTPFSNNKIQVLSGNGSNTQFTLDYRVNGKQDIEVIVNNVQQNPFDGSYDVSNNNILTFTGAPSSGSNNIHIYFRGYSHNISVPEANSINSNQLTSTGVTAGAYGNSTAIPVITVDVAGRVTAASANALFENPISLGNTLTTKAIVPDANVTYDIGTSAKRFKDIYLANSTIYIGNTTLSETGGSLQISNAGAPAVNLATVTQATDLAGNAYSNAVSYTDAKAANAYSNATSYADTQAATAYSNAISYSGNAALAYANAVAYAAANTYVNTQLGLKADLAGATFSGAVSGITTLAAGNTTITGTANVTANLTANNIRTYGSVQIDGDLTVSGNTVQVNVTNLSLEDNMIYLNANNTVSHPDLGIAGNYNDGTYAHAGIFRDATDARWKFFDGYTPEPDASAYIDTANASFRIADIQANTLYAANGVFTSGVSGITTLAAGNTTISGFINATSGYIGNSSDKILLGVGGSYASIQLIDNSQTNPPEIAGNGPMLELRNGGAARVTVHANAAVQFTGTVSGITTLAAGNTTITGFANVSGTAQLSNTTIYNATANATLTIWPANSSSDAVLRFVGQDGDIATEGAEIHYYNTVGDVEFKQTWAGITSITPAIRFSTANYANAMVISGGGFVGVGTTSPGYKIDVTGPGTSNGVTMRLSDAATVADSRHLLIARGSSTAAIGIAGSQANDPLWITRTGQYDMMVAANGTVMLNATTDSNISDASSVVKLAINGDQHFTRQSSKIYFGDVTAAVPLSIGEGLQGDSGNDKDFMSLYGRSNIRFYTYTYGSSAASTEYMRISPQSVVMFGEPYSTYVKTVVTPNGGSQSCRFIEDCLGRWVLVGRFAADAAASIGNTWSSVRGLSTSTSQSQATEFSADWGDTYPTEVRVLGSTNFDLWKENRTIDFVYRVPSGRNWATFFNNGSSTMDVTSGSPSRYGFSVAGAYDGFGRWNNPSMNWMGMSDTATTNPSSAYTTPTTNAFNWYTAGDAKLTAKWNGTYSGQDDSWTTGFGYDDTYRFFNDSFPTNTGQNSAASSYSSAVWILIKLN
jgi:hypothetical protein